MMHVAAIPHGLTNRSNGTFQAIKALVDGDGRPLWQPGLVTNSPNTIMGYPYVINQAIADAGTTSNNHMIFGDMSFFRVRDVVGGSIYKFEEKYWHLLQKGFMFWSRADSRLLDAKAVVKGVHA